MRAILLGVVLALSPCFAGEIIRGNGGTSSGTATTPGGSSGQLQYNNGGAFGGVTGLTLTSSTLTSISATTGTFGTLHVRSTVAGVPLIVEGTSGITAAVIQSRFDGANKSAINFSTDGALINFNAQSIGGPTAEIGLTGIYFALGYGTMDVYAKRIAAGVLGLQGASSGGAILEIKQIASGGTPSADSARFYAKDNSGTAEMCVKDEAGNETQISPHATDSPPGAAVDEGSSEAMPVVLKHTNEFVGVEEWVHVSAAIAEVERLSGKKFIFSRPLPAADVKTWEGVEAERAAKRAAEIAAWQERKQAAEQAASIEAVAAGFGLTAEERAELPAPPAFTEAKPDDYTEQPPPAALSQRIAAKKREAPVARD